MSVQVYVMDAEGGKATPLAELEDWAPDLAFSPDGERIAFSSDRDGNDEIYVMNRDGTEVRRLTQDDAADQHPAYSPDGRRIAFDGNTDPPLDTEFREGHVPDEPNPNAKAADIYVMDADGGDLKRLTGAVGDDAGPRYSPDGKRITYLRGGDGRTLHVMNSDGSSQAMLFTFPEYGLK